MNKRMREIRTQIEMLHDEATKLFEAKNVDGAKTKLDEIDDLEKEYEIAERLFQNEKMSVPEDKVKNSQIQDKVKNFAENIRKIRNSMNEGTGTDGGYTVPEDVSTDIEHLRDAKFSLRQLVTVENVTTNSGKRTYKKRSAQTGFSEVGEGATIGSKATPQFDRISYDIKKYAGILPVTNELLEDSDANIYNELTTWIADEGRVTDNKLIIKAVNTKSKTALSGLDDIKKALNVTLGQAFKNTSKIITNDDGLQYLDTLKDSDGNYLLKSDPTNPLKMNLTAGASVIPVRVIPNADFSSESVFTISADSTVQEGKTYYTKSGETYTVVAEPTGNPSSSSYYELTSTKLPFVIGDLKEAIRLFDRKKINIMTSNVAVAGELNAFEEDLTLFRAIEREDVKVRDADAFVNGYIEIELSAVA